MIRVECKITGEIIETKSSNWRAALNRAKYYNYYWEHINVKTKASEFVNGLNLGYEDRYIKAYLI